MSPALTESEWLLIKYRSIARLRAEADVPGPAPRAALRELARRYPGSLRELDRLPPDVLQARMDELEATLRGAPPPPWVSWVAHYHRELARCLALKRRRAAGEQPPSGEETPQRSIEGWGDGHGEASVGRPQDGRLSRQILALTAARFALPPSELRRALGLEPLHD